MKAWETFEVDGVRVELHYDSDPMSPREWEPVATLVYWHRRYDLGDGRPEGWQAEALGRRPGLFARAMDLDPDIIAWVPLGLIDHSGLSTYVGGGAHPCDPGGWDSGTCGYAYVTRSAMIAAGFGLADITPERALDIIRSEVSTYDDYLQGQVYGFVVDPDGEHEESCWGFYGDDYVRSAATFVARHVATLYADDLARMVYQTTSAAI